ncbi:hypothetical protein DE146DRAFT_639735 [Phaeosphaeria sp. MPI-PUGE-AT-0046c]|nr:hypothetical protein DE146DRAFT_639735 [Phaeosphaeria sp. MPI-PUGE-AT-0046c]
MKHIALLALLPSTVYAACYTPPRPHISDREAVYAEKRAAQFDTPGEDVTTGPSAITIDLPPQFLPPPWSPYSDLDSPYPSGGVSPWDDSGRSQMVDNEPSTWHKCPSIHLDCRKCPGDSRCQPWVGDSAHSSAPIAPEDDGQKDCPIHKCNTGDSSIGTCGKNARCTRGYCVCDLGWRGAPRHGQGWRGNEGLRVLTVYINPETDCDVKCNSLSCKEVSQVDVGVCWKSDGNVYNQDAQTEVSGSDLGGGLGSVVNAGAVGQAS